MIVLLHCSFSGDSIILSCQAVEHGGLEQFTDEMSCHRLTSLLSTSLKNILRHKSAQLACPNVLRMHHAITVTLSINQGKKRQEQRPGCRVLSALKSKYNDVPRISEHESKLSHNKPIKACCCTSRTHSISNHIHNSLTSIDASQISPQ